MNEFAKTQIQNFMKDDPAIEDRIDRGIETNRKGSGFIRLTDAQGHPIPRATVKLALKKHAYHFGCNLFMLGQFPSQEQNAAYEEVFKEVFNLAVVPFYWSDLEPRDGELRFEKNSAPVYRRPPPDLCLEYCERHGIAPKGHTLLWHNWWPKWLTGSKKEVEARVARRFREIAGRYASRIRIWDVVNEALSWNPVRFFERSRCPLPDAHVDFGFKTAGPLFPGSRLLYNDDNKWWHLCGEYSPVYMLARRLLDRGFDLGGLGFQYHMFDVLMDQQSHFFLNREHLFGVLDQYAKLGVPLNLSEVSIIAKRELDGGDGFQEAVLERLYRLWFSHAATDGLVWWNLVDGTAVAPAQGAYCDENDLRAGLLNRDFTPKPAFARLRRFLKEEWTTRAAVDYEEGAANHFRGFYGDYDVTVESAAGTLRAELKLSKEGPNRFAFTLPG